MTRFKTKCSDCGEIIYRKNPQFCPECGMDLRKKPESTSVGAGAFFIPLPVPAPAPVAPTAVPVTPAPAAVAPTAVPVTPAPAAVAPTAVPVTPAPAATPTGSAFSTHASTPVTARVPNQKNGGSSMKLGKILFPIMVMILGITALILSLITFPLFMGGWAAACVLGAILMIVGSVFGILRIIENKFGKVANGLFGGFSSVGAAIFLLTLLVIGMITMAGNFNKNFSATGETIPAATTTAAAAVETASGTTVPVASETAAATATAANIAPVVNNGINKAKDEMFLALAGDVVVGDISVKNTDGTLENLYDNDAGTALVTIFTQDTWAVGPFNGAFLTKQATQSETDQLIADKAQDVDNYHSVVVMSWPANTSTVVPVITPAA